LLRSLVVGSTIPNVALTALRRLQVRIPSIPEQQQLVRTFESQRRIQQQIDALSQQQSNLGTQAWQRTGLAVAETEQ
jgi:restriction endonuclease S subunit